MRDTIKNRIDDLPVTLMSKKLQKGLSMAKPECIHECMTKCAMIMYDEDPQRFVNEYFSSLKSYVETALYDDQENGINLETFREELLNSSTKLGQAFIEYVKVSIDIFETE
jgi:pantothenate kinase-related protein Tda10